MVKRRLRPSGAAEMENGCGRHQPPPVRKRTWKNWPARMLQVTEGTTRDPDGHHTVRLRHDRGHPRPVAQESAMGAAATAVDDQQPKMTA